MREFTRQKAEIPPERARLAPERAEPKKWTTTSPESKSPSERKINPFMDVSGKRNYRAIYKTVYSIHERNAPPAGSWKDGFWKDFDNAPQEIRNDPFFICLLNEVFQELARESEKMKDKQNS